MKTQIIRTGVLRVRLAVALGPQRDMSKAVERLQELFAPLDHEAFVSEGAVTVTAVCRTTTELNRFFEGIRSVFSDIRRPLDDTQLAGGRVIDLAGRATV